MSWLNSELPNDWPSNKNKGQSNSDFEFSTSQSEGSSLNIDPTVAIQINATPGSEPWRHAIQPPQTQQENSHRVTRLFVPPPDITGPDPNESARSPNITMETTDGPGNDASNDSSSLHSSASLQQTTQSSGSFSRNSQPPQGRRLKVFGRPDTYTNERLGNLLTSMGGPSTGTHTTSDGRSTDDRGIKSRSINAQSALSTRSGTAANISANESDADLADQLQNEGRKVLQGLTPFHSNLPPVQESSLDQLEQQLTHQGTSSRDHRAGIDDNQAHTTVKFDTTSSSVNSDSGNTLESLPAGLSNWDTMGPIPHHLLPKASRLHRTSSQTLVGSGGRSNKQREAELADLEAEISALGIQEVHDPSISQKASQMSSDEIQQSTTVSSDIQSQIRRHQDTQPQELFQPLSYQRQSQKQLPQQQHHQYPQQIFEDEASSSPPRASSSSQHQTASPISTSQRSSSAQSRLFNSDAEPHSSGSEVEAARIRSKSQTEKFSVDRYGDMYDVTPDTIFHRNLRFKRPEHHRKPSEFSRNSSSPRPRGTNGLFRGASHQSNRQTSSTSTRRTISSGESRPENAHELEDHVLPDRSIALKDVSFSAGYEMLAHLIRERAPVPGIDPQDMDSLDLSNCDLESIVGLDAFTPQLTTLFLNDNNIRSLEGLPFSLVHLDLSSNHLSFMNLFPQSFVSTLILTGNQLRDLEPLANLRALSSLDVSHNRLTSLKGIENLTALRTLNVNNNHLTSLDVNLGMLSELSAANNDISAVKINAPNLESLDLENNRVVALTEPFPNLRELNIRFNDATIDFKGWESLETLLFDGNRSMIHMDEVAGNLVTFSWEHPMGYNGPRPVLPSTLVTSARDLKLGGAPSIGWPFSGFHTVHSTQHLDLSNGGLRELPVDLGRQFPFLKSANFSFNKLNDDCIEVLANCRNLERLSLFGNRLHTSGEQLAQRLPKVRVLDSRSQNKGHHLVQRGEYPTEVYAPLADMTYDKSHGQLVKTRSSELQWLDGKWTINAWLSKPTTRPAFPSALYPMNWNPPEREAGRNIFNETEEISMIGTLQPWDLFESMYVHHYLQSHRS